MPYEYDVRAHTVKTMGHQSLQEWLNEMGATGWRLVSFHSEIDTPIIFERKIEANQKLRDIQLGKENQDDDGKKEKE